MTPSHNRDAARPSSALAVPSIALRDHIRRRIATTRAPTVGTRARAVAALGISAALLLVVVALASQLVYRQFAMGLDVETGPSASLLWTLSLLVLVTVISTFVVLWRGPHGLGAGVMGLATVAALAAPLYAALTVLQPLHSDADIVGAVHISPWGVRCALISAVVGLGVMASFVAALRRAVPVASRLRGAALGAASGAWAGLAVFMFCPSGDRLHLLVGHVLPVALLTVIGLLVAPERVRP